MVKVAKPGEFHEAHVLQVFGVGDQYHCLGSFDRRRFHDGGLGRGGEQVPVGRDSGGGEERHVDADVFEGFPGPLPRLGVVGGIDGAAEIVDHEVALPAGDQGHRNRGGHQLQRGRVGHERGEGFGDRAGVEKDHAAFGQQFGGEGGDGVRGRLGHGDAGEVGYRVGDPQRAAVGAAQLAVVFEGAQVPANGFFDDAETARQLPHVDPASRVELGENALAAALHGSGEAGSGCLGWSTHDGSRLGGCGD